MLNELYHSHRKTNYFDLLCSFSPASSCPESEIRNYLHLEFSSNWPPQVKRVFVINANSDRLICGERGGGNERNLLTTGKKKSQRLG